MSSVVRYLFAPYFILFSLAVFSQRDKHLDSLIISYTRAESDTDRINKYADIGLYMAGKGNYIEANTYYQKIIRAFSKKYPQKCIDAKNKMAFNFISLENYTKADSLIKETIAESTKLNYQKGLGMAYRNLGLISVYKGKYKEAVAFHLKALEVWEKTKDKKFFCVSNSDLGVTFYYQENYEKAIYYWETALNANPNKSSIDYIGDCSNIGQAYVAMGDYDKATFYLKKPLNYYAKNKNSVSYTNALSGIANIEFERKNYQQALIYYTEIIDLRQNNNTRNNDLAITYLNISLIYSKIGKPKEALAYGLQGYQNAIESGDKSELLHAYTNLNSVYAQIGNYEKAYEFSQLYTNLRDSVSNTESKKQINELDKKYQTEKKEKENQLLNKQLEIQQIQSKQQQLFLLISGVILFLIICLSFVLYKQNAQKQKANYKLALKNKIIEEQHKDITDSIKYAQRIQQAILPAR